MGNEVSREEKQEKKILCSPSIGEASDLYWACHRGDIDAVKQILAIKEFNDINRLEPNGSTALHVASFNGHVDVVRLLLQERGVTRHRKNRYGLTAYEEAVNEEIRQLFQRPNNARFCNNSTDDTQNIFNFTSKTKLDDRDNDEDNDEVSGNWLDKYADEQEVRQQICALRLGQITVASPLLRSLIRLVINDPKNILTKNEAITKMQEIIDKHVTSTHPEYAKACELLSKYTKTNEIEHLLRLYSLETPFYQNLLNDKGDCLALPLLIQLKSLRPRAFCGRSYRGLSMTKADVKEYRWAFENKGSIISTRSFCSTSDDEAVARRFIPSACNEKRRVLMIFDFPQPCDMAVQLYALSEELPCISDFEDEREVLLLPYTIFHVTSIVNDDSNNHYTIHLENVLPKMDLKAFWDG